MDVDSGSDGVELGSDRVESNFSGLDDQMGGAPGRRPQVAACRGATPTARQAATTSCFPSRASLFAGQLCR
jgi:hypothetical protein